MARERPRPAADSPALAVLRGGGDMGALARALDWSRTPIGPVESWPQSLRTALSILLESKFPMLLCWGPDFIQFYNDPFRPILGATKHPALGKGIRETFAEAWHIIGPLFEQVMGGQAVGFEDMLVPLDRNGYLEECYFVYSYSPIRDETGGVAGVLVTCTETTARVLAERRLGTLRELASQAAQAQHEARAWQCAADVLATNAADLPFSLLYALDADGQRARLIHRSEAAPGPSVILESDQDRSWPLHAAARGEPLVVSDVRERFGHHAGPTWPECVAAAMVLPVTRPGLARPYGFLVAGISPRRALDDRYRDFLHLVGDQIATAVANARQYEEERRRTAALVELDRQKTAFFSNVSHEFRTPLTLVLGPLEDALASPEPTLGEPQLRLAHRNAVRLLRLVNTLLDFSRIEAGRARAAFEATDLAALTADLASTFRSLMEQAGLRLDIDCPPIAPVSVDRDMWEKIVLNLLSNAFKFTQQGGVRISQRDVGGRIELRVQDTGAGISARDLPHVFDRFYRVDGAPSRTFEGSGIGLALVRELVAMHGGDVAVESVEGEGTTFTVVVPSRRGPESAATSGQPHAGAAAAAAQPYLEEARRWTAGLPHLRDEAAAGDGPVPAGERDVRTRILVVDDNADMREYASRLLSRHWTVDAAPNGRAALDRIAAAAPDLIVTDIMMPELDGLELLRRVRASPATRAVPIIMLSARAGEDARVEGLSAGADDYLVKPFAAREFVARVRTQLEVSRLRRETAAQNERLLALIRHAPAAIAVVRGPDHVYELANDLYLEMVGRRELVGRPGREAIPELIAQGVWDLFDCVYVAGQPYTAHEFRVEIDRSGEGAPGEGFFNFALQPLVDPHGQTEGILIHAVEVTGEVLARRALEDARRSAESANRAKDEFLAMLGHELRNPLAPILTALQMMTLRGDVGGERERAVIDRQVRHVVRLVDDLLDVSRIARGKIELKRERIELAALVAKAVEMASPLIQQKRQQLDLQVPRSGLAVDGDPMRLQQVLLNLLNNAAKYTEPDGRISIAAEGRGSLIEIRIRDSGIGMEPAMLPGVFDLFVQVPQALDRSQGGLGLGLAIVKNLVELHGGSVRAQSEGVGRGSEFVIRLPASSSPVESPPPAVTSDARGRDGAGLRVLIVDDNSDAAELLAEALALAGYDTQVSPDGPSALRAAARFAPQVAVLDLGLPVMNGYELAARLRDRLQAPKLIAVTGYGRETDRQRSAASGFDCHFVKPVDVEELLEQLRRLACSPRPSI